jgi:predicted membrane metal-binding protein
MMPQSRQKWHLASAVRSPAPVREAFNASGTVHLIYVSGFYVVAVYGAIFFLLRFLIKQVRFQLTASSVCSLLHLPAPKLAGFPGLDAHQRTGVQCCGS